MKLNLFQINLKVYLNEKQKNKSGKNDILNCIRQDQKYTLIPITTDYIKPNESYDIIIENAAELLRRW